MASPIVKTALAAACLASCTSEALAFSSSPLPRAPALASSRTAAVDVCMASEGQRSLGNKVAAAAVVIGTLCGSMQPASAGYNYPPINRNDKTRCEFKSSAIGQSNAARDKLYDLRECPMEGLDAKGYDIAGAIMNKGQFAKTNFEDATMSKVSASEANFDGAIFSNAIMDRSSYKGSSFKGAVLSNTVLSGTSFEGADLTDTDFSDAYMGDFDAKNICKNPTLKGKNPTTGVSTRASAACRGK